MNQRAARKPDNGPPLSEAVDHIHSREDFVAFVRAYLRDLQQKPEEWENGDLTSFLDAIAAWVEDMDGYYQNRKEAVPSQPSWRTLGQILMAARTYE